MTVRTETTTYEASHGKKPRGKGHWMLELDIFCEGRGCTTETYSNTGTLTEARSMAVHHAKDIVGGISHITVNVLP